jgi:hypothetical protein
MTSNIKKAGRIHHKIHHLIRQLPSLGTVPVWGGAAETDKEPINMKSGNRASCAARWEDL